MRAAIDLALSHSHARAATKAYQHLADPLEHAGDYRRARATYVEATILPRQRRERDGRLLPRMPHLGSPTPPPLGLGSADGGLSLYPLSGVHPEIRR